ncbi:MAG: response regulator [Candidatus Lokiarchaeota archaeon]|nr:response regulator [Candidatus Lokiarchaeota archaeon]
MPEAKKILIVDDEPDIVILTEKFLELENYETIPCTNGNDALQIIEQEHNDIALVLLDLMMPNISGYEILKSIKSNEKFKRILVVLFTVKSFTEDIQKGKELGADGYLVKAVSGKELLSYVKTILEKHPS